MTYEATATTVIIVALVIAIVLVYAQCRSVKKEYKWHSDMLLGAKDDEIKSLKEKISALESQLAVKDTVISELSRIHNSDNEKLWSMNGVLLDKVTGKRLPAECIRRKNNDLQPASGNTLPKRGAEPGGGLSL